jgi:hypothetical protein
MTFINAIVNIPADVDVRIALRKELDALDFKKTLEVRS